MPTGFGIDSQKLGKLAVWSYLSAVMPKMVTEKQLMCSCKQYFSLSVSSPLSLALALSIVQERGASALSLIHI